MFYIVIIIPLIIKNKGLAMSTYTTIEGSLTFESQQSMDKALSHLIKGGWLKDGQMVDEYQCPTGSSGVKDINGLTLTIPSYLYLNLSSRIDELVKASVTAEVTEVGDWFANAWIDDKFDSKDIDGLKALVHENRISDSPIDTGDAEGSLYKGVFLIAHNLKEESQTQKLGM